MTTFNQENKDHKDLLLKYLKLNKGTDKNDDEDFIMEEGKKINLEGVPSSKFVRDALK